MKTYHTVVAEDWTLDGGTDSKAPQVILKLKVLDGPQAGQSKMYYASLHENAAEYTLQALRALGWTGNEITDLTGLGTVKATAVEDDHTYKGKTSRKIKFINPFGGKKLTAKNPVPKDLASRFKALAATIKVELSPDAVAPSKEELANLAPTTHVNENLPLSDDPF